VAVALAVGGFAAVALVLPTGNAGRSPVRAAAHRPASSASMSSSKLSIGRAPESIRPLTK